jgi:hypothetical protein
MRNKSVLTHACAQLDPTQTLRAYQAVMDAHGDHVRSHAVFCDFNNKVSLIASLLACSALASLTIVSAQTHADVST